MSDHLPDKRLRAGDRDRDEALAVLEQAHAEGRLSFEELGARQDAALRAVFTDELSGLVDDLPETGIVRQTPLPVPAAGGPTRSIAVLSGRTIRLEPGRPGISSFAWWGGDDIYLADALGPGVTLTLTLHAVMGGADVYVPRGVRVIDEATAIMAGNDVEPEAQGDGSNGTVILKGVLLWDGNDVRLDRNAA